MKKKELELNEMEQALAGMNGLEKMVLGMNSYVSLRCRYTRFTNCQVLSAQDM